MFVNKLRDYTIPYENELQFFWMLWCGAPLSLFTAVRCRVLEAKRDAARKYEGSTTYGYKFVSDSFRGTLQYCIWQENRPLRAPVLADTIMARQVVLVPERKQGAFMAERPVTI